MVKKRNLGVDDDHDGSGSSSLGGPVIKINVSHASHYEVLIPAQSTFGDVKKLLMKKTGLDPKQQRLFFNGKEIGDEGCLHTEGVSDKTRLLLLEGPAKKEMKLEESRECNEMLKASKAVTAVRLEVDKLSEMVVTLEVAVGGGTKVSEEEFRGLRNLLMGQLTKLDSIEAQGEAKLQRKAEVLRVQNFVNTVESLMARNNGNALRVEPEEQHGFSRGKEKENEEHWHMEDVDKKKKLEESRASIEMMKASEAVDAVRSEVDELSEMVAALQVAIDCGTTVSEKEFQMLNDLLMKQLLKLDTIEAKGEAKLQRKAEVLRVQKFVDTVDSLKTRSSDPFSNGVKAGMENYTGYGNALRVEPEERHGFSRGKEKENEEHWQMEDVNKKKKLEESRARIEMMKASEAVDAVRSEVDELSEMVAALQVAIDCGTTVSEKEFQMLNELLMKQLLKLDTIEAKGEAKLQRKAEKFVDTLDSLKTRSSDPFSNGVKAGMDIKERFSIVNGPRIHQLKLELANCKQGGQTVATYYGRLKTVWDELANYEQIPICKCEGCSCDVATQLEKRREEEKVHQFLMGLDDDIYGMTRSNLLTNDLLPSLNRVYSVVIQEECVRMISRTKEDRSEVVGLAACVKRKNQGETKDKSQLCNHCNKFGHGESECFQVIGYPEWWGERPRNDGKIGGKGKSQQHVGSGRGRGTGVRAHVARTGVDDGMTTLVTEADITGLPGQTADQWQKLVATFYDHSR